MNVEDPRVKDKLSQKFPLDPLLGLDELRHNRLVDTLRVVLEPDTAR